MRRLAPTLAVLATIAALIAADCAKALPFSSRPQIPAALDDVACRPPPWFRGLGLQTSAPFVCADYWWWPRYYYFAMGARYRHYHRTW
jgi:hypothetical protein